MVVIDSSFRTKHASVVRKARTEKIRVVRLESDLYYVSRRAAGHGRYMVKFFNAETVRATCTSVYDEPCRGSWKDRCCTHIAAAVERGIKLGREKKPHEAKTKLSERSVESNPVETKKDTRVLYLPGVRGRERNDSASR